MGMSSTLSYAYVWLKMGVAFVRYYPYPAPRNKPCPTIKCEAFCRGKMAEMAENGRKNVTCE